MFEGIVGHNNTKHHVDIAIKAAKKRNEATPHMLFSGVAGCGKTTMALETARAAEVDIIPVSPDEFSDRESTLRILERLNHDSYDSFGNRTGKIRPSILFIDEIHRTPGKGQEILGIAMEKLMLDTGKPNRFYWIPHFTIIGATTDDGRLTKPFREKFKLRFLFETYSLVEIEAIIVLYAASLGIVLTKKAWRTIALRSRGVPRIAKAYLESIRDYAVHVDSHVITSGIVLSTFKTLGIDSMGLTKPEINILKALYKANSPVGVDNLAIISNESLNNIKNTIEPYLIQEGLIIRTGKGRILTDLGRKHLEEDGYLGEKRNKSEIPADYERK